jgi:protein-disulfide isomerase
MDSHMKIIEALRRGAGLALPILVLASVTAHAAGPAPQPAPQSAPDAATVDAVVRRLEASGALDRAVERSLQRLQQRQDEANRAAQAQREAERQKLARAARKVATGRDHILGDPAAEVSLIEYSDFECPFCTRFHGSPGSVMQRYPGRVNWVFRHFPLSFHEPAARREAIAAECAGQLGGNDVFWKYAHTLFRDTRSNGQGLPEAKSTESIASQLGLDASRFSSCMAGAGAAKRVDEDLADGAATGITGTPTTVVRNNRTGASVAIVGAQPVEVLVSAVEKLLTSDDAVKK